MQSLLEVKSLDVKVLIRKDKKVCRDEIFCLLNFRKKVENSTLAFVPFELKLNFRFIFFSFVEISKLNLKALSPYSFFSLILKSTFILNYSLNEMFFKISPNLILRSTLCHVFSFSLKIKLFINFG